MMLGRPGRVGTDGRARARARPAGTGSTARCSSRTPSRRCSRSASGTRPTGSAPPRFAPSRPTSPTCSSCSAPTSSSAAATSTPRGHTSKPPSPRCARTAGRASTTSASPSWPCGSGAGRTPTRRCATAWRRAIAPGAGQLHVWLCAKGLRAHAELAALARARRDADAPSRARLARHDAAHRRSTRRGRGRGRHAQRLWLARAGRGRARARARRRATRAVVGGRSHVGRLERPPLAAYCRWRQAEALVAAGAARTEASVPLRQHTPSPHGSEHAAASGARAARPTRAARSRRTGRRAVRRTAGLGGDPRPDAAGG